MGETGGGGGKGIDVNGKKDEGKFALGDVVGEILLNLQKFKIVLRGDVAASIMTISVSEGLILQLDPDFDMVRQALPFFVRYKGWSTAEAVMRGGGSKSKSKTSLSSSSPPPSETVEAAATLSAAPA